MIANLQDKTANTGDLDSWLREGWGIVSVRQVDGDAEQSIMILITVESSTNPGVATFRKEGTRRTSSGLPH